MTPIYHNVLHQLYPSQSILWPDVGSRRAVEVNWPSRDVLSGMVIQTGIYCSCPSRSCAWAFGLASGSLPRKMHGFLISYSVNISSDLSGSIVCMN